MIAKNLHHIFNNRHISKMRDMQTVRQQSVSQQRHISLNEQESDIKEHYRTCLVSSFSHDFTLAVTRL